MVINSKMLAKFILLTILCSISVVARFSFLKPIQPKKIEGSASESDSFRENPVPLRTLNVASTTDKKSLLRGLEEKMPRILPFRKAHSDPRELSTGLLTTLPQVEQLASEQRLYIKRNWEKNQYQLESLYKDSKELSTVKSEIRKVIFKLKWRLKVQLRPKASTPFLLEAFETLQKLNESLVTFKKVKVLELGRINLPNSNAKLLNLLLPKVAEGSKEEIDFSKLPNDIIQVIIKKSWITLGNSVVRDLKEINSQLARHEILINQGSAAIMWWKCGLETIDFLFKNGFAGRSTVGSFFQDPNTIRQLIYYIDVRYEDELQESIVTRTTHLTEHWYWSLLHDSFRSMSKKQEVILNGHVMLHIRYLEILDICKIYSQKFRSQAWINFFVGFDSDAYLIYLMRRDATHSGHQPIEIKTENRITSDVETIITLIANSNEELTNVPKPYKQIVLVYVCEMLEFIDRVVSPKIIEKVSRYHPKFLEFDKKYNTLLLCSKMNNKYWMAHDYHRYVTKRDPSNWFTSPLYQSKFKAYLDQFLMILDRLKDERSRLKLKLGDEIYNLELGDSLLDIASSFQNLAQNLRQKLSISFS